MSAEYVVTIWRNDQEIGSYTIGNQAFLGRSNECTIFLDDRAISREHVLFKQNGDQLEIEKKSKFGILKLNGSDCVRATLKESDMLQIGPFRAQIAKKTSQVEMPRDPNAQGVEAEGGLKMENGAVSQTAQLNSNEDPLFPENSEKSSSLASSDSPEPPEASNFSQSDNPAPAFQVIEDEKTKIEPAAKVSVKLIFPEGAANYTDYEINQNEISIGRGSQCDIILNDKKSSRKNSILRRVGLNFIIKDLGSSNGTFVNGEKIEEKELSGDDSIRIGNTDFQFKVSSAEYSQQERNFMSLPSQSELVNQGPLPPNSQMNHSLVAGQINSMPVSENIGHVTGDLNHIAGLNPGKSSKKGSLLQKFRALPKNKQYIVIGVIIVFIYWFMSDDTENNKTKTNKSKKPTPNASVKPKLGTFDSLPQEKKDFIIHQHDIAFNYYTHYEYDMALNEIRKIFEFVQDYKDSREIESYAIEGKRKLAAREEENRKKQEAEKLRAAISKLEDECQQKMQAKKYDEARDLFSQLLSIDPDNIKVSEWKKEIDAYEENRRAALLTKQVEMDIYKKGVDLYKEALYLKKLGKFHSAINVAKKISEIGITRKKLIQQAHRLQVQCRLAIKNARDPLLDEAKKLEEAGELKKAFDLYRKATHVDPPHPAGYAGMNRIKGILHDHAKAIYTEAIIAESYSDFAVAKKLFQKCLDIAPPDDIYHDRAQRKLSHYFQKDEAPPQ